MEEDKTPETLHGGSQSSSEYLVETAKQQNTKLEVRQMPKNKFVDYFKTLVTRATAKWKK